MSWNHRIVKKTYPGHGPHPEPEDQYSVVETFYNDDGSIYAYTAEPVDLACESLEALLEYTGWCLKAITQAIAGTAPVLVDGKVKFSSGGEDADEILNEADAAELSAELGLGEVFPPDAALPPDHWTDISHMDDLWIENGEYSEDDVKNLRDEVLRWRAVWKNQ